MPPTRLCIFARPMRTADRAMLFVSVLLLVATATSCTSLDGRNRNRKGNHFFRATQFVDAAAEYQKALTEVDDPIIHYNLGLAYSKVFRVGAEGSVPLDVAGSFACKMIPNVNVAAPKTVCVKPEDKHFKSCDEKDVCPSSFKCENTALCTIDNAQLADMAAQHFGKWLESHPDDAETRGLMTQVWIDSEQYPKALAYWKGMLDKKPNDPEIMGNLAGINLKAGDWRKSIAWYLKVADISKEASAKVAAYQFIGNVAWSKLNSKTLSAEDSVDLADMGIGALQMASEIAPKNPKLVGLRASIYNFRSLTQGASWAASLDRAAAQELQQRSRVLAKEAKKAQEESSGSTAPSDGATTSNPSPASTGG